MACNPTKDESGRLMMKVTVGVHRAWWAGWYFAVCRAALRCVAPLLSERRLEGLINWIARFYANHAIRYQFGDDGKWQRLHMTGAEDEPKLKLDRD